MYGWITTVRNNLTTRTYNLIWLKLFAHNKDDVDSSSTMSTIFNFQNNLIMKSKSIILIEQSYSSQLLLRYEKLVIDSGGINSCFYPKYLKIYRYFTNKFSFYYHND